MKLEKKVLAVLVAVSMFQGSHTRYVTATDVIKPHEVCTSSDFGYEKTMLTFKEDENELIIPIQVESEGCLSLGITQNYYANFGSLKIELFEDADCLQKCGVNSLYLFSENESVFEKFECSKSGIYYIKASLLRNANEMEELSFSLVSAYYSSANRFLNQDELVYVYDNSMSENTKFTINVKNDGVIYLMYTAENNSATNTVAVNVIGTNGEVFAENLYTSNQSDLTRLYDNGMSIAVVPVKAGTCTVEVKSSESYVFGYTFVDVNDISGKSKSSAKLLTKGKKTFGLLYADDSNSEYDWYKIKLNKRQKVRITMHAESNDLIQFDFMSSNGKILKDSSVTLSTGGSVFKTLKKWDKGTYYVRIRKVNNNSSGLYSLTLK